MERSNVPRMAVQGFGAALIVLMLFSCVSFNIADAPGKYVWPNNHPVANWCGPIGAFMAYYLLYYFGPGVLVLLGAILWVLVANIIGRPVGQMPLRCFGLVLLVCVVSGSWYLLMPFSNIWPYGHGVFPMGSGGILGIALGGLLIKQLAVLGTVVILASAGLVGAILLADTVVLAALGTIGGGAARLLGLAVPALSSVARERSKDLGQIWKRLSERQKASRTQQPVAVTTTKLLTPTLRTAQAASLRNPAVVHDERLPYAVRQGEDVDGDEAVFAAKETAVQVSPAPAGAEDTEAKPESAGRKPAVPKEPATYIPESYDNYTLPPLAVLRDAEHSFAAVQEKMVDQKAHVLEGLLAEFGINAQVVNAEPGPAITMYELELAPGVKVSQISNLANDMARALGAPSVRVVAPLAGRHTIGIEVPNTQREIVRIKDLMERAGSAAERMYIPIFLGKSSSGEVLLEDLASMPHLLIAGTTGSGKSVCINSIIVSILLTRRPDEVKLIMIDPKMVEMTAFETIPHLMCPIVTETKQAEQILEWAMTKMDERYELLAEARVRNIASYNKLTPEEIRERFCPSTPEEEAKIPKRMPHIVIVIDELADLMMTAAKEIEAYIVRLAQKSRAVGIHLVVATQRPQATVVTGLIKSNMPARVGFRVAARMDSRIILDQNGAEALLGQGDMLFLQPGTSDLVRAQGAFVDDEEVRIITRFLKDVAEPQFHPELMQLNRVDMSLAERDELFDEAVRVVLESHRGSVSLLQRRLGVGYARASRMVEMMAAAGILGEYKGSQSREVLMTLEDYETLRRDMLAGEVAGYEDLSARPHEQHDQADEADDDDRSDEDADDEEYNEPVKVVGKDKPGR